MDVCMDGWQILDGWMDELTYLRKFVRRESGLWLKSKIHKDPFTIERTHA